jgi:hypothetical protein
MAPYNYLVSSPGAFDWCAPLSTGMVLHHSVTSTPNHRKWFWQVVTDFDTRVYRIDIVRLAQNEPSQTIPTLQFSFFFQQFFGEQLYSGLIQANSPYPIQTFFVPVTSPDPINPPGICIPLGLVYFEPVPWWTTETPGGN